MNTQKIKQDLETIVKYDNSMRASIKEMYSGVGEDNIHRKTLDSFLRSIGLESNPETRLGAYFRMIDMNENSLSLYMEKKYSMTEIEKILDAGYTYTTNYYLKRQEDLLNFIEDKELLTPFYVQIFHGVHGVGKEFNNFFLAWRKYIINNINKNLENNFEKDSTKIIEFLNKNNLFDKGHLGEGADRSYSALVIDEDGKYTPQSYKTVFPLEVASIMQALDIFILQLQKYEDEVYDSKKEYIEYLNAIKNAFDTTDVDSLVQKWAEVDAKWMQIKTPFQITHPLEFYQDKYRKAVASEWDLRIQNTVFESVVQEDITNMYEVIYDTIGRENFPSSYEYSLANIQRVQMYLSTPILSYGSHYTWLFSAQVVPNDDVVSKQFGKKIFAFPESVLHDKRAMPFMKLSCVIFDETLLHEYRKYLFSDEKHFYRIYDIDTIGHEFGHTLWLDLDNESIMNQKTGVYKNIEEFKATTGGLMAYFMGKNENFELSRTLMMDIVMRILSYLQEKKSNEIEPYYCEALIHLVILLESGVLSLDNNKVDLHFNEHSYEQLKQTYLTHYTKLIHIYLNKIDAQEFLKDYTIKEGLYYLPKDPYIRDFVHYFYDTYEKIGNELDETVSKEKYLKN